MKVGSGIAGYGVAILVLNIVDGDSVVCPIGHGGNRQSHHTIIRGISCRICNCDTIVDGIVSGCFTGRLIQIFTEVYGHSRCIGGC